MWLLDANMDVHVVSFLRERGYACDAAASRGWGSLENGALVLAAVEAGFVCLLTQDRLFAESAKGTLKRFPRFGIVVVRLHQRPWREYLEQFRAAWEISPIQPVPGEVVHWPAS